MRTPLGVAALLLLLAWTSGAAEGREATDAAAPSGGEAGRSPAAAPAAAPTVEKRASGRNFLAGAAVLAAAVVATAIGFARKPRVKVFRHGQRVQPGPGEADGTR